MVADVPVGVLLSGGIDSSLVVALLAEEGQRGLTTFSIGFDSAGGESGDEFEYSDLIAKTFDTDHHQILIDTVAAAAGGAETIAAMSEPMVSHDCVAFYLLSEEVSKSVKVVQSGQGADEMLAGYDWYPPLADVRPRAGHRGLREGVLRPRRTPSCAGILRARVGMVDDDPSRAVRRRALRPRRAPTPRSTRRCGWTPGHAGRRPGQAGRQHDDGLGAGGPGAVPRPRARRTRRGLPARAEAGLRRQGRAQGGGARVVPDEVIDRTKGYFPVPGIRHLEGPFLDRVRDALTNDAARARGLFVRRRSTRCWRPRTHAHHAGLQRVVAAGAAGDVAAEHGSLSKGKQSAR